MERSTISKQNFTDSYIQKPFTYPPHSLVNGRNLLTTLINLVDTRVNAIIVTP